MEDCSNNVGSDEIDDCDNIDDLSLDSSSSSDNSSSSTNNLNNLIRPDLLNKLFGNFQLSNNNEQNLQLSDDFPLPDDFNISDILSQMTSILSNAENVRDQINKDMSQINEILISKDQNNDDDNIDETD